ncbi:hypothetical protein [Nodosilinea sp. E11]|uniref:hypothetical protein n=1 Tax=Nodosilinea sp. E11 TaxID=3037479 RepID=UPI002934DCDE|nr:hypothetical protein [Nodosilinea sp. E11]WOD37758.1 hypothetical protein RRF56_16225 [Nodosilinea sp. E11]
MGKLFSKHRLTVRSPIAFSLLLVASTPVPKWLLFKIADFSPDHIYRLNDLMTVAGENFV